MTQEQKSPDIPAMLETSGSIEPEVSQANQAFAEIEAKYQKLDDARKEDKFISSCIILILFNSFVFSHMENFAGAIIIGIIELIMLLIIACRNGVEEVTMLLSRVFAAMGKNNKDST
jgi:hypothetical protein